MPHEANQPPTDAPAGPVSSQDQAALQEAGDGAADARAEAIGAAAPPAAEPLDSATVNALAQTISQTLPRLELPAMELAPVDGDQQALPPDVFAVVAGLGTVLNEIGGSVPEAQPYVFDPIQLSTTNAGLEEMSALISAMGTDEAFLNALKQPGPAEAPAAPPAAPEPDAASRAAELTP